MFKAGRSFKIIVFIALAPGLVLLLRTGCSPRVKMRTVNAFEGVEPSEVEKIKASIENAGISGHVVSIQIEDETYLVLVHTTSKAAETGTDRKQMIPVAPASYRVNKKTGEVRPAM